MNRRVLALLVIALLLAGSRVGIAQATSTITNVSPAGPLVISTAVAGQEPTGVSANAGTYDLSLKNKGGLYTITAQLSAPLPPGTTLSITLASPGSGAQSVGSVVLTTSPQPVVTNLSTAKLTLPGNAISYSFSATSAAGVLVLQPVTVILALAP